MTLSFVFFFSPSSFSAAVLSCWRCSVDAGCATSCVLGMDAKARALWYFCHSFSHLIKQDNTKNNITPSMTAIFDLLTQCYFSGLKCLWKDKIVTISHSVPAAWDVVTKRSCSFHKGLTYSTGNTTCRMLNVMVLDAKPWPLVELSIFRSFKSIPLTNTLKKKRS